MLLRKAQLFYSLVALIAPAMMAQTTLNSSVSDFGTTFTISPPPICRGCLETELGAVWVQGSRLVPGVVTFGIFDRTDLSVLLNVLDSEKLAGKRVVHPGDRLDFVLRRQVLQTGGFTLVLAPRGTSFLRGLGGGRVGGTVAAQYDRGKHLFVANLTLTRGIHSSVANPSWDYQGSMNYYLTLTTKGLALFGGLQHEASSRNAPTIGTEQGLIIPFRDGQAELAVEELVLNRKLAWQFQVRLIKNWKKM